MHALPIILAALILHIIQDVLKEPINEVRFTKLKEYFTVLGTPGHASESSGLFYTIMHIWRLFYLFSLAEDAPQALATAEFYVKAGVLQAMMRIAGRAFDHDFFMTEYNRMVPYRALEVLFAATQSTNRDNELYVDLMLEDSLNPFETLNRMASGELTSVEQIMAIQLAGNFTYTDNGTKWVIDHPEMMGKMAYFLWLIYDVVYTTYMQFEDIRVPYMTQLAFTKIQFIDPDEAYEAYQFTTNDIHMYHILCSLCNVCAAHPDDEPMERLEPALLSCVTHGIFDHAGLVLYGCVINDLNSQDQMMEKFLSFFSWSVFQIESQRVLMEQLKSRPFHRGDRPLFYDRDKDSKCNSVLAILNTHMTHMDYEKGSNFVTLAMVFLLKEDEDFAMEVIRWIGDSLIDLSHSTFHAPMPDIRDKPTSVKRMVLENMLRFGGSSFYDESGAVVKPSGEQIILCTQ